MPPTTQVRVGIEDYKVIESLMREGDTCASVLARIIDDYKEKGTQRQIVREIGQLEETCRQLVHEDYVSALESLKAYILRSTYKRQFERGQDAQKLSDMLGSLLVGGGDVTSAVNTSVDTSKEDKASKKESTKLSASSVISKRGPVSAHQEEAC